MKKLTLLVFSFLIACAAFGQAPQYGRFHKALFGSAAPTATCLDGTLYYSSSLNKLYVCESAAWVDYVGTLISPIFQTSVILDQSTADYTFTWANPAAGRAISITDPGGTDVFAWRDATQTLLNKTLTTPSLTTPTMTVNVIGNFASRIAVSPTTDTLAAFKMQDNGGAGTGWFDTTVDGVRTYGLYLSMNRPTSGVFAASAGVDDATIRTVFNNYANTHSNYIARGINVSVQNRADATLGQLEAGVFGIQNRSGNSTATTLSGTTTTVENYSSNAVTTIYGAKIDIRDESGVGTPTVTGLIVHNSDNSTGDSLTYGIHLTDTGTNTGFASGFSTNGATVNCEFELKNGACLYSGAQTTRDTVRGEVGLTGAIGSLYLSSAGKLYVKVANADATADWEKVTSTAAD